MPRHSSVKTICCFLIQVTMNWYDPLAEVFSSAAKMATTKLLRSINHCLLQSPFVIRSRNRHTREGMEGERKMCGVTERRHPDVETILNKLQPSWISVCDCECYAKRFLWNFFSARPKQTRWRNIIIIIVIEANGIQLAHLFQVSGFIFLNIRSLRWTILICCG